jgi:hypothetical protein
MATITKELLFLKSNGVLIGEITDELDKSRLDLSQFLTKIVNFNEDTGDYWHGDFHSGEVRSRSDKPVITESYVKYSTNLSMLQSYPIHKQLSIIVDMLAQSTIEKTPEFNQLKEFLDIERQKHNDQITAYAANPAAYTWVSEDQEQEIVSKKREI